MVVSTVNKQANSELSCASVSKRGLVQNLSYENDFALHENKTAG